MRYRLRTLLIMSALIPLAIWMLDSVQFAVWDGGFVLNIKFVNNTGRTIEHIEGAVVGGRAEADYYVSFPQAREKPNWKPIVPGTDGVAQLYVNCSGRESWTGREFSYWHQRAVVARVEFAEGSESLFAIDIPPQRGIRNLVVDIPSPK